mgnify:FL=1|jgi:hypothetical protein
MKKCSPGVICIETTTMIFTLLIVFSILWLLYLSINESYIQNTQSQKNVYEPSTTNHNNTNMYWGVIPRFLPSWPYNNLVNLFNRRPRDIVRNPYVPPLRDERYNVFVGNSIGVVPRPSNLYPISTNVGSIVNSTYRQVGMLTPMNQSSDNNIISLMGRPVHTSRDKWQYYSISNQQNAIKLPLSVNGRSAMTEYGVDRLSADDTVYVEGINQPHRVTMYDNDSIQYLPFV